MFLSFALNRFQGARPDICERIKSATTELSAEGFYDLLEGAIGWVKESAVKQSANIFTFWYQGMILRRTGGRPRRHLSRLRPHRGRVLTVFMCET